MKVKWRRVILSAGASLTIAVAACTRRHIEATEHRFSPNLTASADQLTAAARNSQRRLMRPVGVHIRPREHAQIVIDQPVEALRPRDQCAESRCMLSLPRSKV